MMRASYQVDYGDEMAERMKSPRIAPVSPAARTGQVRELVGAENGLCCIS
jgi:hypothetical protein